MMWSRIINFGLVFCYSINLPLSAQQGSTKHALQYTTDRKKPEIVPISMEVSANSLSLSIENNWLKAQSRPLFRSPNHRNALLSSLFFNYFYDIYDKTNTERATHEVSSGTIKDYKNALYGYFISKPHPFLFFNCEKDTEVKDKYFWVYSTYISCIGFYYLDSEHHHKVYQYEYYRETKKKKKQVVLELDFSPKLGFIRYKMFDNIGNNAYPKPPLGGIYEWIQPPLLMELRLQSIDNIPLSEFIQQDTCITPFCDIDKRGCE